MSTVAVSRERVQITELQDLLTLFNITPKKSRKAIVEAIEAQAEKITNPPPPELMRTPMDTTPLPQFVPTPPIKNIFEGMVWGENKTAFVQLEHLVNEMRQSASTYRLGLYGPPSVGKTMTAGRIARALERRYFEGSATFLSDFPNAITGLATIVSRLHEGMPIVDSYTHDDGRSMVEILAPTVFFVDEAHEMPNAIQNALLPIMEAPYRAPYGDRGYLDFRNIMFIFGTTDPAHLLRPLRTRCREISFVGYSAESVAMMVRMKYPDLSHEDGIAMARAGKLYPRRALSVARTCCELERSYGSPQEVLKNHMGIDNEGLDPTDRRILEALDATRAVVSPVKLEEAKLLVQMYEEGNKVPIGRLVQAKTLVANPTVHRPIGRQALAERIMSTDSKDIMERVTYLEQIGRVFQSSRGVQLAV